MKTKLMKILIILIFILGLGILLYPIISNLLMNVFQTTAIQEYNYTVEQMEEEGIVGPANGSKPREILRYE